MKKRLLGILLGSNFVVAVGFGILLPVLPTLFRNMAGNTHLWQLPLHTGALASTYMLSLFLLAPVWGWLSRTTGKKCILILGLAGFALSMLMVPISEHPSLLYLAAVMSGGSAAAVVPMTLSYVVGYADAQTRAKYVSWLSAASGLGFILGPALSGGIWPGFQLSLLIPFAVIGFLSAVIGILAYFRLPNIVEANYRKPINNHPYILLSLLCITMIGVGAFEVGLSLQAKGSLGLRSHEVGWLFAECGLIMVIVQFAVVPVIIRSASVNAVWITLCVMGLGLFLISIADSYLWLALSVAIISSSIGVLIPVLSYLNAMASLNRPGLGASAVSLGQAIGSGFAGWMFNAFSAKLFWAPGFLLLLSAWLLSRFCKTPLLEASFHKCPDEGITKL
jgi:predicted MFS family arabinose efflux permease